MQHSLARCSDGNCLLCQQLMDLGLTTGNVGTVLTLDHLRQVQDIFKKNPSVNTVNVPIIAPLTAYVAGATPPLTVPVANVITISRGDYAGMDLQEVVNQLLHPPKVTHAFLAMISE